MVLKFNEGSHKRSLYFRQCKYHYFVIQLSALASALVPDQYQWQKRRSDFNRPLLKTYQPLGKFRPGVGECFHELVIQCQSTKRWGRGDISTRWSDLTYVTPYMFELQYKEDNDLLKTMYRICIDKRDALCSPCVKICSCGEDV
jgi:hypothetical protein